MNLVAHAREELQRAGLFDKDSDYGGMLGEAVLELVQKFAEQGHSGFSAQMTLHIFNKVARFQTLTPISSDPTEWMEVTQYFNGKGVWQNRRNPAVFSEDGGKTWYDLDERERNKWFRLRRRVRWALQDVGSLFTKPFRRKKNVELLAVEETRPEPPKES
jgi:hypothetical protein